MLFKHQVANYFLLFLRKMICWSWQSPSFKSPGDMLHWLNHCNKTQTSSSQYCIQNIHFTQQEALSPTGCEGGSVCLNLSSFIIWYRAETCDAKLETESVGTELGPKSYAQMINVTTVFQNAFSNEALHDMTSFPNLGESRPQLFWTQLWNTDVNSPGFGQKKCNILT